MENEHLHNDDIELKEVAKEEEEVLLENTKFNNSRFQRILSRWNQILTKHTIIFRGNIYYFSFVKHSFGLL